MNLPLYDLFFVEARQLGLVVAVVVGFGFGFVLERAGFGRATKLAAQFYGNDMTVFKVMFGAIVTAALGTTIAGAVGLVDLGEIARHGVSWTYMWPMLAGGLLLGVGFIVAGYCPGTSVVAAASGNIDGMVTLVGVGIGCFLFAESFPMLGGFLESGNMGHLFLYDLLHVPPVVAAAGVTLMAVGCFVAADYAERYFSARYKLELDSNHTAAGPRRFTFAVFGGVAVVALALLALPGPAQDPGDEAGGTLAASSIGQEELVHRVLEQPWTVRVLDLRDLDACGKRRIPGAECVPPETLGDLGLAYAPPDVDLVLVGDRTLDEAPAATLAFRGDVLILDGGFQGWEWFALTAPVPPDAPVDSPLWEQYHLRAGLHSALTGVRQAPPPPTPTTTFVAPPSSGGGGCG
jgi:Sulphur transport